MMKFRRRLRLSAGARGVSAAGALLLTVLTSFLTAASIAPAAREVVYGLILLGMLSLYGRQRALRQ
jgi:ribose transport system permease protein